MSDETPISLHEAREQWAKMDQTARRELIEKVRGDVKYAIGHDWAGLPPEAHSALLAVMQPETPPAEPAETTTEDTGRRGRRRSDD
jgi:hypothetical protein